MKTSTRNRLQTSRQCIRHPRRIYMEINEWLDTDLGVDILNNKYRHNDESLEEWFARVGGDNEKN